MIDFPSTLPQPSTSFSGDVSTPTIRTELDNGLVEQYGRFSTKLESFSVSWVLSQAELVIFETWFNDTLAGGVLVWNMLLPDEGGYAVRPVRFVGGQYTSSHKPALWFNVSARVECLTLTDAAPNRTLPIPQWLRLAVDPTASQVLTLAHRNAILTVRPDLGSTTTLRINPPIDDTQYIYFGISNQGLGETLITSQDVAAILPDAVPAFPGTLPNINQSFGVDAKRKATRIDMESGHPRQYAELETTVKTYQVEWDFTLAQLKTFQDFFFVSLKSGALTFTMTLPVDGLFIAVPVRFVGGKYGESYLPVDTFRVTATVERIVDQTVIPSAEKPYPIWYSPTVNVTANRKIGAGDAKKFFVVTPAAGQTISLHLSNRLIEFGLLIKGLGNVLITRGPFIVDIGAIGTDGAGTVFAKPTLSLISILRDFGNMGSDNAGTTMLKPTFSLVSVAKNIGTIPTDNAGTVLIKPTFELKAVLKNVGTIPTDNSGTTLNKPTFSLD